MSTLKSAIVARFDAISGGVPPLYFEEAPETTDPSVAPYAVYLLIEAPVQVSSGDGIMQDVELQVSAFATSAPAAEAIGRAARLAFDPARARTRLEWDDGRELTILPLGGRTMREEKHGQQPDRGPGGVTVYHRLERFVLSTATTLAVWHADPPPSEGAVGAPTFDLGGWDAAGSAYDATVPPSGTFTPPPPGFDTMPPPAAPVPVAAPTTGFDSGSFDAAGYDAIDAPVPAVPPVPPVLPPGPEAVPFDAGGFDTLAWDDPEGLAG